jgi:hypothetical protein
MVLAELNIRHTRRHMPTRRVAVGDAYLPTAGTANGARLLAGVVAEQLHGLDEEQQELLPRFLADARKGLMVPRIALRYRLQTDTHGLDRSRHRLLDEHGTQVLELDVHGHPAPQVLGAVLAAASLPPSARRIALDMVDRAVHARSRPDGMKVRLLLEGVPGFRPFFGPFGANPYGSGAAGNGAGPGDDEHLWRGVSAERRWAMEVLGLRPGMPLERRDVQQRFRRLVRVAHPDQGGAEVGAAERLNELAEAREVLLSVITRDATEAAQSQPG